MNLLNRLIFIFIGFAILGCENAPNKEVKAPPVEVPKGMVWVPSKTFTKGAKEGDQMAMKAEKPSHQVQVDGFFIDATEVTNKDFAIFVEETGYTTLAEKPIDWDEMKKELPPGTPKPHDSLLQAGSLIFNRNALEVENKSDYHQWWEWKIGANWKHPEGPDSSIEGKEDYPVVHIAYEDALAYCEWANRRLPTEAEWESAALGNQKEAIFPWGNEIEQLNENANTWQGVFPTQLETEDGHDYVAPTKSYPPNSIELYDMMGNVWEITQDYFNVNYYASLDPNRIHTNPKGADRPFNPNNPNEVERIIKGGSFLCHGSYCASFRISARMGNTEKSSSEHVGFRTVAIPEMLKNNSN